MKYITVLLANLLIVSSCNLQNNSCTKKMIPKLPNISNSTLNEMDKQQVVECFISNVEYYRVNPLKIDEGNLFDPYGCYYANDSLGYVKLPSPSKENLQVSVGSIYLNSSKLISMIFLGVKQTIKQNNIEKPQNGREYFAMCLIGLRKDTLEGFTLYPSRLFLQVGYPNFEKPLKLIVEQYFNCLAKTENMWGKKYRTNLGDKDFWKNNLLFDKVITTEGEELYYFQTYSLSDLDGKSWNNHHKYDVVQCSN